MEKLNVGVGVQIGDTHGWQAAWHIEKYQSAEAYERGEVYEVADFGPNLLLDAGAALLLSLLIGGGGTAYNNTNARLGVGNSAAAEDPAQTGLQGASKTYKAMEATYPQISGTSVIFRSVFGADDANYDWREFCINNAADETGGIRLNRKVSNQGTKAQGQTWTLTFTATMS